MATKITHLFTPNIRVGSQERAYLELNDADYVRMLHQYGNDIESDLESGLDGFFKTNAKDGAAQAAIVTDQNTARMFLIGWNNGYYTSTCPVSNFDILEEVKILAGKVVTGKAKNVPLYTQEIVDARTPYKDKYPEVFKSVEAAIAKELGGMAR
jgi:hypothetical protein